MDQDLLWLGQPGCERTALVGGKAANLSRLAALHPVPSGFCLTAAAHRRAGGAPPPDDLRATLASAYRELAEGADRAEPAVAVRSSAVDEDGALASFAGLHETYLNVVGADAVAEAVARCWASATAERALEYRRRQGLPLEGVGLAVLVQELIRADVSLVVFSANPLSGSRGEVVINASWGLGESVVGGTVTPDTYVLRKADRAVLSRQIADKARMTVLAPSGTREVDVPRVLRAQPTLDDAGARLVAELAVTLEATMGWPVDVECAFAGDRLYLLQCRPITTLGAHR
jgi:pyruvate,water dikinase